MGGNGPAPENFRQFTTPSSVDLSGETFEAGEAEAAWRPKPNRVPDSPVGNKDQNGEGGVVPQANEAQKVTGKPTLEPGSVREVNSPTAQALKPGSRPDTETGAQQVGADADKSLSPKATPDARTGATGRETGGLVQPVIPQTKPDIDGGKRTAEPRVAYTGVREVRPGDARVDGTTRVKQPSDLVVPERTPTGGVHNVIRNPDSKTEVKQPSTPTERRDVSGDGSQKGVQPRADVRESTPINNKTVLPQPPADIAPRGNVSEHKQGPKLQTEPAGRDGSVQKNVPRDGTDPAVKTTPGIDRRDIPGSRADGRDGSANRSDKTDGPGMRTDREWPGMSTDRDAPGKTPISPDGKAAAGPRGDRDAIGKAPTNRDAKDGGASRGDRDGSGKFPFSPDGKEPAGRDGRTFGGNSTDAGSRSPVGGGSKAGDTTGSTLPPTGKVESSIGSSKGNTIGGGSGPRVEADAKFEIGKGGPTVGGDKGGSIDIKSGVRTDAMDGRPNDHAGVKAGTDGRVPGDITGHGGGRGPGSGGAVGADVKGTDGRISATGADASAGGKGIGGGSSGGGIRHDFTDTGTGHGIRHDMPEGRVAEAGSRGGVRHDAPEGKVADVGTRGGIRHDAPDGRIADIGGPKGGGSSLEGSGKNLNPNAGPGSGDSILTTGKGSGGTGGGGSGRADGPDFKIGETKTGPATVGGKSDTPGAPGIKDGATRRADGDVPPIVLPGLDQGGGRSGPKGGPGSPIEPATRPWQPNQIGGKPEGVTAGGGVGGGGSIEGRTGKHDAQQQGEIAAELGGALRNVANRVFTGQEVSGPFSPGKPTEALPGDTTKPTIVAGDRAGQLPAWGDRAGHVPGTGDRAPFTPGQAGERRVDVSQGQQGKADIAQAAGTGDRRAGGQATGDLGSRPGFAGAGGDAGSRPGFPGTGGDASSRPGFAGAGGDAGSRPGFPGTGGDASSRLGFAGAGGDASKAVASTDKFGQSGDKFGRPTEKWNTSSGKAADGTGYSAHPSEEHGSGEGFGHGDEAVLPEMNIVLDDGAIESGEKFEGDEKTAELSMALGVLHKLMEEEHGAYLYITKEGDTVELVARDVVGDARTAPLVFSMNKEHVLQSEQYGVYPFKVGVVLNLPTPRQIKEFFDARQ